MKGVSFLIPLHGADGSLRETVEALLRQEAPDSMEVLLVDDGKNEAVRGLLEAFEGYEGVRLIPGEGRGAAAAINRGLDAARFSFLAQIDQDVLPQPGWLEALLDLIVEERCAAVQGVYVTDRRSPMLSCMEAADLGLRWATLKGHESDHVCTGNTLYRTEALRAVGGLDENFGYGYDNDLSYRLREAGWTLKISQAARSSHRRQDSLASALFRQYGLGMGRLDLVAKYPGKWLGDRVSGPGMILQLPMTAAVILSTLLWILLPTAGARWRLPGTLPLILSALLLGDRALFALRAFRRSRDPAAFLLLPFHLLRNLAWLAALFSWSIRSLFRIPSRPWHSMTRR